MRKSFTLLAVFLSFALPAHAEQPADETAKNPAEERERLAVLAIDSQQGAVEPAQLEMLGQLFVAEVRKFERFEVLSTTDIESMLGKKRSSEFLSCADAACMAQLADSLNVRHVAGGSVARFGEVFMLNLKLVDLARTTVSASVSKRVPASADALLDALPAAVTELFTEQPAEGAATPAPAVTAADTTAAGDVALEVTSANSPAGRSVLRNALFTDSQIDSLANHGIAVTPQVAEIVERLNNRGYNQDEIHRFAIKHELFSKTAEQAETWVLYYTAGLNLRAWPKFIDSRLSLTEYFNEREEGIALDVCKWGLGGFAVLNVGLGFIFREISPIDLGTTGSGTYQTQNKIEIYWQVNMVLAGASLIGSIVCFIIDALDRGQVEPGFFESAKKRDIIDVVEKARTTRRDEDDDGLQLAISPWAADRESAGLALSLRF